VAKEAMREMSDHPRLFLPGPVEIAEEVARAGATPMIGHRGPEITELLRATMEWTARMLHTRCLVFPLPCSATGAMEGAIRNLPEGPVLHLVCGAFSKRWSQIRAASGMEGEELEFPWGQAVDPDAVRDALRRQRYEAVTLVHNETSTGVINPLGEIAAVVREESDALLLVDTVSSMAAVELHLDEWGIDLCLAGSQKAWALPPGLSLVSVSSRALERSARARSRGFYFDWTRHAAAMEKGQTPTTPPISLLFQLQRQQERMDEEGLSRRYARHRALRDRVLQWAEGRFSPFAAEGYRSPTLSALHAGPVDVSRWLEAVKRRGFVVGAGYGPTRGELFRIGHMGETTLEQLEQCLSVLDEEHRKLEGGGA